jgi:hypothetical protein
MAYINGYEHDIFISYSHLDNQKFFGQSAGWIEIFYAELNKLISQRIGKPDTVKIWWDNKKLDGSVVFDDSIAEGINRSALLVCLTSSAYLQSEYCQKELKQFYNKAQEEPTGLKVGNRSRVVNVLLNNIPYTQWPSGLNGTTGFPFYDAKAKEDLGDPFEAGDLPFKTGLKELRDALIKLMSEFPAGEKKDNQAERSESKEDEPFTIFFGDVADSLRTARKRTITELEKKGFKIICDVPPPFEAGAHEKLVTQKLKEANLSVHLLDQFPGREIDDNEGLWYPQKQVELGLQFAPAQMIWLPAETDLNAIEDQLYKTFMSDLEGGKKPAKNIEFIRGAKSTLTQEITDLTEKLKIQQKQPATNGKVAVLLDAYSSDQKYAWELGTSLLENQIQPFVTPQEDDPRNNSNLLGDRISQVNKLVFFYGKVEWTWVQRRVHAAMKLIINNEYPADEFFIFLLPPHKNLKEIAFERRFLKVNVIDNSDALQLDKATLQQFFETLKTVA